MMDEKLRQYFCLICEKEIRNDDYVEQNIEGIIFRGYGNWFSSFDQIGCLSGKEIVIECVICDKCLLERNFCED